MENNSIENNCNKEERSKLVRDVKEISLNTQVSFGMDSINGFFFRCHTPGQVSRIVQEISNHGYKYESKIFRGKHSIYISSRDGRGEY